MSIPETFIFILNFSFKKHKLLRVRLWLCHMVVQCQVLMLLSRVGILYLVHIF